MIYTYIYVCVCVCVCIYIYRERERERREREREAFLVSQMVKNLPARQETQVRFLGWEDSLEKGMAPTPVFLPGKFHGQRILAGYSPRDCKESDTSEILTPLSLYIYIYIYMYVYSMLILNKQYLRDVPENSLLLLLSYYAHIVYGIHSFDRYHQPHSISDNRDAS